MPTHRPPSFLLSESTARVAGFASIVGLFVTIGAVVLPEFLGLSIHNLVAFLAIGITLVMMSLLTLRLVWENTQYQFDRERISALETALAEKVDEAEDRADAVEKVMEKLHNVAHETRDLSSRLQDHIAALSDGGRISQRAHYALHERFSMYNLYFLDNVKEAFDILTGDECATNIKLTGRAAGGGDHGILVKTYMRDTSSYKSRSYLDQRVGDFPYFASSAFKDIMDEHTTTNYFASDDLAEERGYISYHEDWQHFYNARIVMPLRHNAGNLKFRYLGLLCIDNNNGGLSNETAVQMAAAFADMYFTVLDMMYMIGPAYLERMDMDQSGPAPTNEEMRGRDRYTVGKKPKSRT